MNILFSGLVVLLSLVLLVDTSDCGDDNVLVPGKKRKTLYCTGAFNPSKRTRTISNEARQAILSAFEEVDITEGSTAADEPTEMDIIEQQETYTSLIITNTRKISLQHLSDDLLANIGSFLQNPFESLPLVSKRLNTAMKQYSPQWLLSSRARQLTNVLCGPDLRILLNFDVAYLNDRWEEIMDVDSIFKATSPRTIELTINYIKKKYERNNDKLFHIGRLVSRLWKNRNFPGFIRAIQYSANYVFPAEDDEIFIEFVFQAVKMELFQELKLFRDNISRKGHLLAVLASSPISLDKFQELIGDFPSELVLEVLSLSLTFNVPELTEEEDEFIFQRNLHIMSLIPESPDLLVLKDWTSLCLYLRYSILTPEIAAQYLNRELIDRLILYANEHYTAASTAKAQIKMYCEALVISAVKGNYLNSFLSLLKNSKVIFEKDRLRPVLIKKPEFLEAIKSSNFKRLLGTRDQVLLWNNSVISLAQVNEIRNLCERIRVLFVIFAKNPIEFRKKTTDLMHTNPSLKISKLIEKFISTSENSAVPIAHLLMIMDIKQLDPAELKAISINLGHPKYLKSLLNPKNDVLLTNFNLFDPELLYITITEVEFKEFMNLASVLKEERARGIRNRMKLSWNRIFKRQRLYPWEIVKFLDIFNVRVSSFASKGLPTTNPVFGEILRDSRVLFRNPEKYSGAIDIFLQFFALDLFYSELTVLNRNPFTLKSFGILQLWKERNFESFLLGVPFMLGKSFVKDFSPAFLRKILFDIRLGKDNLLPKHLFTHYITTRTEIKIRISSLDELRILSFDILPFLQESNFNHIVPLTTSDLQELIELSESFLDFEIISTTLTEELINAFLKRVKDREIDSHKSLEFYFYYTIQRNINVIP